MGQAVLSGFQVVTGLAKDPAAKLAAAALTRKVDGKVDAGVYRLGADALEPLKGSGRKLGAVPAASDGGPLLVFIHGTFSDTVGTFSKLWTLHNATVRQLFASYGDRVYGLDHPTLGVSPIANALTLVRALPAGARVHLVTHSRGGLVGRGAGARVRRRDRPTGVLALFAGDEYAEHRSDLKRARQGSAGEGNPLRARRPRRLPGARHAAGVEAARRVPLDPQLVPRAGEHPGRPRSRRLPARGRARGAPSRASCPGSRR